MAGQLGEAHYLFVAPDQAGAEGPELSIPDGKILLLCDVAVTEEFRQRFVQGILGSGAKYVVCWGSECEVWQQALKQTFLEMVPADDLTEENFVMVTQHAQESRKNAMWYAKKMARHPVHALARTLILHISEEEAQMVLTSAYAKI